MMRVAKIMPLFVPFHLGGKSMKPEGCIKTEITKKASYLPGYFTRVYYPPLPIIISITIIAIQAQQANVFSMISIGG